MYVVDVVFDVHVVKFPLYSVWISAVTMLKADSYVDKLKWHRGLAVVAVDGERVEVAQPRVLPLYEWFVGEHELHTVVRSTHHSNQTTYERKFISIKCKAMKVASEESRLRIVHFRGAGVSIHVLDYVLFGRPPFIFETCYLTQKL